LILFIAATATITDTKAPPMLDSLWDSGTADLVLGSNFMWNGEIMAEKSESILRDQLATATRMMVMADLMDYSGHLSARVPGTDRILIQPRDASRAGLKAEEILVVDMDGEVIEGNVPAPPETPLHLGVYRAREDVFAIAHAHPPFSIMFIISEWMGGFPRNQHQKRMMSWGRCWSHTIPSPPSLRLDYPHAGICQAGYPCCCCSKELMMALN
jgi:hypothetical protein